MNQQRKSELDFYRLIAKDDGFKIGLHNRLKRILAA